MWILRFTLSDRSDLTLDVKRMRLIVESFAGRTSRARAFGFLVSDAYRKRRESPNCDSVVGNAILPDYLLHHLHLCCIQSVSKWTDKNTVD